MLRTCSGHVWATEYGRPRGGEQARQGKASEHAATAVTTQIVVMIVGQPSELDSRMCVCLCIRMCVRVCLGSCLVLRTHVEIHMGRTDDVLAHVPVQRARWALMHINMHVRVE